MAPPETKLVVDFRIGVVTFDKVFRLLKVSKGLKWVVGRSRIVGRK
jgi:hypothetical protein